MMNLSCDCLTDLVRKENGNENENEKIRQSNQLGPLNYLIYLFIFSHQILNPNIAQELWI